MNTFRFKDFLMFLGISLVFTCVGYTIYIIVYYGHAVSIEYSLLHWKMLLPLLVGVLSYMALLLFSPNGVVRGSIFLLLPSYVLRQAYRFLVSFHATNGKF